MVVSVQNVRYIHFDLQAVMNMEWRPEYEINVSKHAETDSKLSVMIQAPAWTWANWGKFENDCHNFRCTVSSRNWLILGPEKTLPIAKSANCETKQTAVNLNFGTRQN